MSVFFHLPLLESVQIELNLKNHLLEKLEGDRKRVCEKMLKSSDSALVMNEPGTGQGNKSQRSRLSVLEEPVILLVLGYSSLNCAVLL